MIIIRKGLTILSSTGIIHLADECKGVAFSCVAVSYGGNQYRLTFDAKGDMHSAEEFLKTVPEN